MINKSLSADLKEIKPYVLAWIAQGGVSSNLGILNVIEFGAVGDGVNDDTTAIQAAITACPQNGMVYLPPGTYHTTAALTISTDFVTLCGSGMAVISLVGSGNVLTVTGNDCLIENLYLTSDHANAGHGLSVSGGYDLRLKRVYIAGVQYHALYLLNSWNVLATDCLFASDNSDSGYAGIYLDSQSNAVTFLRCRCQHGNNIGADVVHGAGVNFDGCTIEGSSTGIGIRTDDAHSVNIRGCYFEAQLVGIQVGNANKTLVCNISGCYWYVTVANGIGVKVVACYACDVRGNSFYGTVPSGSTGIYVDGSTVLAVNIKVENDNIFPGVASEVTDAAKRAVNWIGPLLTQRRIAFSSAVPQDGGLWSRGSLVLNSNAASGQPIGWLCTFTSYAVKESWVTGHAYTAGDFICGYTTFNLYRAENGATAGATEPTHTSGTVSDGAVNWKWVAYAGGYSGLATFVSIGNLP